MAHHPRYPDGVPSPRLIPIVGGAAVVVAAGLLLAIGRTGAGAAAAASPSFPAPPSGATVYSRQRGNDALALAVVPRQEGVVLVRVSVVGRQGNGIDGLRVSLVMAGQKKRAVRCDVGCYGASFAPGSAPHAVDVSIAGGETTQWHVDLPAVWPPRDGSEVVRRAGAAWRKLHSLTFRERLASGTGQVAISTWRIQAPDRLAYQVLRGWAGVVIGGRRWDRAPGSSTWQPSAQTRLHQPVPFWVSATDAHILGPATVAGRPAIRVSFFDPGSPAWFTIVVDRTTYRTLDSRMVTNAHFMHDVYGSFNSTSPIVPPR